MYSISFDLDATQLQNHYPTSIWQNAYADIKKILLKFGFKHHSGSVYFGGENVNSVTCVLAAQELSRTHPWFKASVREFVMMRIEEMNDLNLEAVLI